jgi:hypothetical protein
MVEIKTINDIKIDLLNANKGTEGGQWLVKKSLENYGFGRSILVDKDGNIIAGNKTFEKAKELNLPIKVIDTGGKEIIIHQRTDLKLDSKEGRELAIVDNRSSEIGLDWDHNAFQQLHTIVDFKEVGFNDYEIQGFLQAFEPIENDGTRLDEKNKVKCPECGCEFAP